MMYQHSNSKYQNEYYLENTGKFHFFFRNSPIFSSNLTVTNSRNKVITVNYMSDTLSNANGWMSLLLDQEIYTLSFSSPLFQRNLQVMKVCLIHQLLQYHIVIGNRKKNFEAKIS